MKILPPQTQPPSEPQVRRHQPKPVLAWAKYRPCLRWDFGFTCAFCLLHEADFFHGQPGEGLGVMTVEHHVLKRDAPSQAGVYTNCLYACRLCNTARGTKDLETPEGRLLNPATDRWADHFETVGSSSLQPKAGDADARYTFDAYDLDNESKTTRRQTRWELITDRQALRARIGEELILLLDLVSVVQKTDPETYLEAWEEVSDLRQQAVRALADLEFYSAEPKDAPESCRCTPPREFSLPSWLTDQCSTLG